MRKINPVAAAFLLAMFSFGPTVYADIVEKEGVSVEDLKAISPDFKFVQKDNTISFYGEIPARCAENARVKNIRDGEKQAILLAMPNCQKDFKPNDGEPTVDVADVFRKINLADISGKIALRHMARGSRGAPDRAIDEELRDHKGNAIEITGAAERKAQAEAARKKEQAEADAKERKEFFKKLNATCRSDQEEALTMIEQNAHFFENVQEILQKGEKSLQANLERKLRDASNEDEAEEAYNKYLDNADRRSWENQKEMKTAYIEKRFALIDDITNGDEKGSLKAAAAAIDKWVQDFNALDSRLKRKNHPKFGELYGELVDRALKANRNDEAERYVEKAKKYASREEGIKFEAMLAKDYADDYQACVENGPRNAAACAQKYKSKSKEHAEKIKNSLAESAKSGDGTAVAQYSSFMSEFNAAYGMGFTLNDPVMGPVSQVPGSMTMNAAQSVATFVQQQQQQQMLAYQQQMMQRQYGGSMPGMQTGSPMVAAGGQQGILGIR